MTINVGDSVPAVKLKRLGASGLEDVDTGEFFKGRKVVVFSVPGAFTPTCSKEHLPGFIEKAKDILGKGVDEIACLSVNDPFVMDAWSKAQGAEGKVSMLPDWDGSFTKALGLDQDLGVAGLGVRGKRFQMTIEDGVVKSIDVEPGREVTVSGAAACLTNLG